MLGFRTLRQPLRLLSFGLQRKLLLWLPVAVLVSSSAECILDATKHNFKEPLLLFRRLAYLWARILLIPLAKFLIIISITFAVELILLHVRHLLSVMIVKGFGLASCLLLFLQSPCKQLFL